MMPSCENGPHTECACCGWKVTQADMLLRRLAKLREITAIQCSNGNWDYDAYMLGMANGMLLAIATMTDEDFAPLTAPDEWLKDRPRFVATVCDAPPEESP